MQTPDPDTMTRNDLADEVRRLRVLVGPDPAAGDPDPALALGMERTTAFAVDTGLVHRHSALAVALGSPYGGKGTREPDPYLRLPERTARQAAAEYRELLRTFAAAAEALGDATHGAGGPRAWREAYEAARDVLRKHNRPRPG